MADKFPKIKLIFKKKRAPVRFWIPLGDRSSPKYTEPTIKPRIILTTYLIAFISV